MEAWVYGTHLARMLRPSNHETRLLHVECITVFTRDIGGEFGQSDGKHLPAFSRMANVVELDDIRVRDGKVLHELLNLMKWMVASMVGRIGECIDIPYLLVRITVFVEK